MTQLVICEEETPIHELEDLFVLLPIATWADQPQEVGVKE